MLYLLDANVLIDADRDYYPISRVPEFWEWLEHHGAIGNVKICVEVYEEVTDATGVLPDLLKTERFKQALLLSADSDPRMVAMIVNQGYAVDLTDIEIVTIGRDPFLIAHALENIHERCVVTTESSAPSKKRQNRRIPDVCKQFNVKCYTAFEFFRDLNFSTSWK